MTYAIKTNSSLHAIASMFDDMGRKDNFSLQALSAILDYLEEWSEDGVIDLDIIAICCEFTEESPEEVVNTQGWYIGEEITQYEVARKLNYRTWALALDNGNILYINF